MMCTMPLAILIYAYEELSCFNVPFFRWVFIPV